MTPERWRVVSALFHDVRALDDAQRVRWLDEACHGDAVLRAEVEQLVSADRTAGAFEEAVDRLARPAPRRRPHPFVYLAVFFAAVSCVFFIRAGRLLMLHRGASTQFGWTEAQRGGRWNVNTVDPAGPAAGILAAGDRILSIDAVPPIRPSGTTLHRRQIAPGQVYRLSVERSGGEHAVVLRAAQGPSELTAMLTYALVSLIWCVIGMFIGFARPDLPTARLACTASVATALVFLEVGVIRAGPLWQPWHMVLGYHFFCRFPDERPARGVWGTLLIVFYAASLIHVVLGFWIHWTLLTQGVAAVPGLFTAHPLLFRFRGGWGPLVSGIGAATASLFAIRHAYRRLLGDQRRRVQWVLAGSAVALAPLLWWNAVWLYEELVGPAAVSRFSVAVNAATTAIPLVVAYAVLTRRVFDIRVAIARGVQYLLARRALQAAVTVPLVALAITLVRNRDLPLSTIVRNNGGYLSWAALAMLALRVRRPVHTWLDRKFFRERHDPEQVLLRVVDDLSRADSLAELTRLAHDRIAQTFHPAALCIYYRDPWDLALASSSDPAISPPDFPATAHWIERLAANMGSVVALPPLSDAMDRTDAWLHERDLRFALPMSESSSRIIGAVLLGSKQSGEPYRPEDFRLLKAVATQLAVVYENLRLRIEVSEEQRIRHDVLARLDGAGVDVVKECPRCGRCYDSVAATCEDDRQALTLSAPVPREVDGKYRLLRLIGKGGMGSVYEAEDLRLGRIVAIKIMVGRAFGDAASVRRFHREAHATARLAHPNVVVIHDVSALRGGGAYLVMERLRGHTLRTELERHGRIDPAGVAAWFGPVLDGLGAAHAAGIVHRDLKPENIIGDLTRSSVATVKILDFGLAKLRDAGVAPGSTVTADGSVIGTLAYMAPEQLLGRDVDQRSDLFAVGVMLVEALTGRRPFGRDTYSEMMHAVLNEPYHLPGWQDEARALDAVLQSCLAKLPADRVASACALSAALVPALADLAGRRASGSPFASHA